MAEGSLPALWGRSGCGRDSRPPTPRCPRREHRAAPPDSSSCWCMSVRVHVCTVCMCVHVCVCVCMHAPSACVCTCMRVCVCMFARVRVCLCVHGVCVCTICMCMRACVCAHVCAHMWVPVCTHVGYGPCASPVQMPWSRELLRARDTRCTRVCEWGWGGGTRRPWRPTLDRRLSCLRRHVNPCFQPPRPGRSGWRCLLAARQRRPDFRLPNRQADREPHF